MLDIGAGDGKFLQRMRQRGFSPTGTTASSVSARAAMTLFGLHLEFTESLDAPLRDAPYDLMTYWHVYEHLADPATHTMHWATLVRPGGYLLIEVPNIRSLGARLCYRAWLGSDDQHHVNHQAPETILAAMRQQGIEPVRVEHASMKFSYVFLWSALLGFLFGRRYDFDGIMDLLKKPIKMLRARPIWTVNALASIVYLAPVIAILFLYGLATKQGEVVRVYGKRRTS